MMNDTLKNKALLLLTISALILTQFFSCKKKEVTPDVQEGNVTFYFNGRVDDTLLIIEAGKNNYYMYSDVNYDNIFSTYIFSGMFAKENSSSSPNSIKISLIDADTTVNGYPSHINSYIAGYYNYYNTKDISINSYRMKVFAVPSLSPITASYQYSINSSFISNAPNFTYTLSPGNYTLSQYFYNYQDSCYSVLTNTFYLSPTDSFYAYYRYTVYTNSTLPTVTYSIYTNILTPYTYTFNFGDGAQTVTSNTYLVHSYSPYNWYTPILTAQSNNGKIWTFQNNLYLSSSKPNCSGNYYYQFSPNLVGLMTPFSKIIITYVDENKVLYRSDINQQPPTSFFQIQSISEYKINEKNQKTKMIVANLKVRVYSPANPNVFKDISGKAVFAVAYF